MPCLIVFNLNNYLLTTPNISVDLLNFQKSHIRIYMALDGDYSIVTNIGDGGGYMSDIVISEVIDKAINIIEYIIAKMTVSNNDLSNMSNEQKDKF